MDDPSGINTTSELEAWFNGQCRSYRLPALGLLVAFLSVFLAVTYIEYSDELISFFGTPCLLSLVYSAVFRKEEFSYRTRRHVSGSGIVSAIKIANTFDRPMYMLIALAVISPAGFGYLLFSDMDGEIALALLGFPISYLALSAFGRVTHAAIAVLFLAIVFTVGRYTDALDQFVDMFARRAGGVWDNGFLNQMSFCISLLCSGLFFRRATKLFALYGMLMLRLEELNTPPPRRPSPPSPPASRTAEATLYLDKEN